MAKAKVLVTPGLAAEMRRLYLDGLSLRKVADRLACSYGAVHGTLERMGVQFRPSGGGWRKRAPEALEAAE